MLRRMTIELQLKIVRLSLTFNFFSRKYYVSANDPECYGHERVHEALWFQNVFKLYSLYF